MYNNNTTIVTDAALTSILSHFETPYIVDLINNLLEYKFRPYNAPPPSINSIEDHFKLAIAYCGDDTQRSKIEYTREETYKEIIQNICNYYNLSYNINQDQDIYTCAYYIYEFFIRDFTNNLCNFYINYIINNISYLYEYLNLHLKKKDKDSATLYGKKIYTDPKLAIIHANITEVLDNISVFDINLEDLFFNTISSDKKISDFLLSILSDNGNVFKVYFASYLSDTNTRADVITNIKLRLQEYATNNNLINNI
jgi:hypothetical protein